MNRRVKTYGLVIAIAVVVCLVLVHYLETLEDETTQSKSDYMHTTPTVRLSVFESVLSVLQQRGQGEVIFSGGKGFVRFQVREDERMVVLVPVSASIPCVLPVSWARFFFADKYKFHNIRLARHERQRIEDMEPFQDAVERKVAYSGTAPHIFIEAELGSDVVQAAEMTEAILTDVFQMGSGKLGTYVGNYHKFRWG